MRLSEIDMRLAVVDALQERDKMAKDDLIERLELLSKKLDLLIGKLAPQKKKKRSK